MPRLIHDSIIFDIDGTLWSAALSTALAWSGVFETHGLNCVVVKKDIEDVAGRPYLECLEIVYPAFRSFTEEKKQNLLLDLKLAEQEFMASHGGELYEFVREGLSLLKSKYPLYLVSNCQDWYLESFLKHQALGGFFSDSTCHGLTRKTKAENIVSIVQRNGLSNPAYIGDTSGDKQAAQAAHVPFYLVEYGFETHPGAKGFKDFRSLVDHFCNSFDKGLK